MNELTRENLVKALDELKKIVESPKLYLANYFTDLRHRVDKEIVSKQTYLQNEEKMAKLNEIWLQMIEKIDSFEKQCIRNKLIDVPTLMRRFSTIEISLNQNQLKNLNEISKEIQTVEISVLKQLFKNKTIAFVDVNYFWNVANRRILDGKLIVFNDDFITIKSIENRNLNRLNEKILDRELMKIIQMEKLAFTFKNFSSAQMNCSSYILETNLDLKSLQILEFHDDKIIEIDENVFDGLHNLQTLYLYDNPITKINAKAFNGLINLKKLYLYSNKLTELNANAFHGLNNLQTLYLSGNQIAGLNAGTFNGLNSLQSLYLNQNNITKINGNVFNGLNRLKELDLSHNQISEINENSFNGMNNLHELILLENELVDIEPNVFNCLSNLKKLCLINNKISSQSKTCLENHFSRNFRSVQLEIHTNWYCV